MGSIRQEPSPPNDLYSALRDITLRPFKTLKPPWSWKAAILSALLHGVTFYISNLCSGHERAAAAMVVETVFAVFASGLMGAVSQRLRASHPVLATRVNRLSRVAGFDGDGSTRGASCCSHTSRGCRSAGVFLPRIRFNSFQLVCDATWIIAWRRGQYDDCS
jgi:hypothetical protein